MICEIENIEARQILDSRGNPTIEVEVTLDDGTKATSSVPSGASCGSCEAIELRDDDKNNYHGKSVLKAVDNVNNKIATSLLGEDASNQRNIDNLLLSLDCTFNKSSLGANAILGVSLACAKASAKAYDLPLFRYLGGINACTLPVPMMNILNGGAHSNNNLDFQEFMIAPVGVSNFSDAIKAGSEIFYSLKEILSKKGFSTNVGDEGGFAPDLSTTEQAIEIIIEAIEKSGYNTNDIKICLDVAASELYSEGDCSNGMCSLSKYTLKGVGKTFTTEEMIEYLETLVRNYPIISIEDGLSENDDLGWMNLTKKLGGKYQFGGKCQLEGKCQFGEQYQLGSQCQLVGDDLFVTNPDKLFNGINNNMANSILIKPNQIGTLSETLDTILLAQKNNYSTIISHRSGETEDTFIADLSVAVNSGMIKTGSMSRGERTCKYNRLLKIEEMLGNDAKYLGLDAFKGYSNNA